MAKRKKKKQWRNFSRDEQLNQDEIDLHIHESEQLRTRETRWRERLEEHEETLGEAGYDPDDYTGYPLGTVLNMRRVSACGGGS